MTGWFVTSQGRQYLPRKGAALISLPRHVRCVNGKLIRFHLNTAFVLLPVSLNFSTGVVIYTVQVNFCVELPVRTLSMAFRPKRLQQGAGGSSTGFTLVSPSLAACCWTSFFTHKPSNMCEGFLCLFRSIYGSRWLIYAQHGTALNKSNVNKFEWFCVRSSLIEGVRKCFVATTLLKLLGEKNSIDTCCLPGLVFQTQIEDQPVSDAT